MVCIFSFLLRGGLRLAYPPVDYAQRVERRQHCSSLCSQSEGHEHVANMTSAQGHNLVDFQLVLGRLNIRPPHFASKVSYSASPQTSAKCPRRAPCSDAAFAMLFGKKRAEIFLDFEHPSKGYFRGVCHLHSSTNSLSLDKYAANL